MNKQLFIKRKIVVLFFMGIGQLLNAQQNNPNTLNYDSIAGSPKATLQQVAWIQGNWNGEAMGGSTEEAWTKPSGGSMLGTFKLIVNKKVQFYELMAITEENETLLLRLKHFHPDLKGWEEKGKTIDFKLVKITPDKIYFNQFTFEKAGTGKLNIYVVFKQKNGTIEEAKFSYSKWPG